MNFAPICLFTYQRLSCTIKTIKALQKNELANQSDLYIFSDGAADSNSENKVQEVRKYLDKVNGFKNIYIIHQAQNKGLAQSIIDGVSKIIHEQGKVIVIEDDIVTTPNFLTFINNALTFYENEHKVFSVGGYTIPIKWPAGGSFDVYFAPRTTSWGWASWKDRWETVDWNVSDYSSFKDNKSARAAFNLGGSDLSAMLDRQMNHELDSWMIRWCYQQFKNNQCTVFPTVSKVRNIGFGPDATHTKFYDRYRSELDDTNKNEFRFKKEVEFDPLVLKSYQKKYSLQSRITGRIKHYLGLP